jgi:hypothetical protein
MKLVLRREDYLKMLNPECPMMLDQIKEQYQQEIALVRTAELMTKVDELVDHIDAEYYVNGEAQEINLSLAQHNHIIDALAFLLVEYKNSQC